jgi:hypothetical protein
MQKIVKQKGKKPFFSLLTLCNSAFPARGWSNVPHVLAFRYIMRSLGGVYPQKTQSSHSVSVSLSVAFIG